jgi:signal transduction histidine kinase
MQLENYNKAVQNYSRVCDEYPQCLTSSFLPLDLLARVQMARCYQRMKAHEKFINHSLLLYRSLLQKQWYLDADQFNTYSSMVEKDISEFLATESENLEDKDYRQKFESLKKIHQKMSEQWQVVQDVSNSILPELQRKLRQQDTFPSNPLRHSQTINHKEYLILAAVVPHEEGEEYLGLLGVKIKEDYLLNHLINSILEDVPFPREKSFSVSTLTGQILLGPRGLVTKRPTITEYFENNFPPWRIEFFPGGTEDSGIIDIRKSFYFWTILTILVLLTFGTVLVIRTIAHEMEVLRIKSDFVSSVSHEFNTPITAIKALSERLQQGRVKTLNKRKEYYSIISKDADKLSSLVKNILDFSKVEEGKREYAFQETDVTQLVKAEVENFKKDKVYAGIKINTRISPNIPPLYVDRKAFSLALNNLLENAVKFSPERKDIFITVKKDPENVIVEVKDKGMGIDSSEMDKIFDKFYQGKNAAKLSVKGTGLGLALVTHMMDALGGKVLVKSKIGEGSIFSLIFPIREKGSEI